MIPEVFFGFPYFKAKKLIKDTEYISYQEHYKIQNRRLSEVLNHAVRNVPFYKKNFSGNKISNFKDIREALTYFPIIDKEIIRKKLNEFIVGPKIKRLKVTTGGSTGTPFSFYMDRFNTRQIEKAFIFDQWSRVGYSFRDSIFNLRGRTPVKNNFLHHDLFFNIYYASSFNLKKSTVKDYVISINKIHPKFIHGYPSTIYQLALLMSFTGKYLDFKPKAIFCGSEKLFYFQKTKIEKVFGCPTYHWYGHSECLALGGGCNKSDYFHFFPQYGNIELIPSGVKAENGKELYEIVATGFNNPVMPFIRYKTGDYATLSKNKKCSCGRNYLLIEEVVGRQQEFIVDAKHSLISATSLIFGQHYSIFECVKSIKLYQDHAGLLEVILVKGEDFRDDLFQIMKDKMFELIGNRMTLKFSFSESIEKSSIGKARIVDQKLDINEILHR